MMELTECLPDEDKAAIKNAFNKAKMDYFNGEVLATLAGERELLGTTAGTNTGRARNAAQQSPYGNALGSNSALGSGGNGIWSNLF